MGPVFGAYNVYNEIRLPPRGGGGEGDGGQYGGRGRYLGPVYISGAGIEGYSYTFGAVWRSNLPTDRGSGYPITKRSFDNQAYIT